LKAIAAPWGILMNSIDDGFEYKGTAFQRPTCRPADSPKAFTFQCGSFCYSHAGFW